VIFLIVLTSYNPCTHGELFFLFEDPGSTSSRLQLFYFFLSSFLSLLFVSLFFFLSFPYLAYTSTILLLFLHIYIYLVLALGTKASSDGGGVGVRSLLLIYFNVLKLFLNLYLKLF